MTVRRWCVLLCAGLVAGLFATAQAQPFTTTVDFNDDIEFPEGEEFIWMNPAWSGSTQGIVCTRDTGGNCIERDPFDNPIELSQRVSWSGLPTPAYEIFWVWEDPANTSGVDAVRATTHSAASLRRPSMHLGGKLRFKIAVSAWNYNPLDHSFDTQFKSTSPTPVAGDPSILLALGVKETGNDVAQGETDTGGGDLEFVYLPGSILPTTTNGLMAEWPPMGLRIYAENDDWPPDADDYQQIEFDFSAGLDVLGFVNDGNGIDTAGDGVLDATTNGDGVNRGVLEALIFTNDSADTAGQFMFVYIDDVEFISNVADPVSPPTVIPPLTDGDVVVQVQCTPDATSAIVMIDGNTSGVPTAPNGTTWIADVTVPALVADQLVTAKQIRQGLKSAESGPVPVFDAGVLLADSFDFYNDADEFGEFWKNSINYPTPSSAKVTWTTGNAATCQHVLREANPAGADAARLYRYIGHLNGSDEEPLVVTWYFQHRGPTTGAGERTRFELARMAGDEFSTSSAARLNGTTGFILENGPGSIPLPSTLDQYNILLRTDDPQTIGSSGIENGTGFFVGNQGNVAMTGIDRVSDTWHKMQIIVTTDVIDYKIDDVLANPMTSNGTAVWPDGVPRPNGDYYNFLIIGQGYSNNGPEMLYDNVSITIGGVAVPPFDEANEVASPTVLEPLYPGGTEVTILDIDSNATEVAVYVDDIVAATAGGPFLDNEETLVVAALDDQQVVTATQTLDVARVEKESCYSAGVTVAAPAPTLEDPLVPGLTSVEVSDILVGLAEKVTVYTDDGELRTQIGFMDTPTNGTEPITVTALEDGATIIATQDIAGVESADSNEVVVSVPAPIVLGPLTPGVEVVTVTDLHPLSEVIKVYVGSTELVGEAANTSGLTELDVDLTRQLANGELVTATQTIGSVEGPESTPVDVAISYCKVVFKSDMATSNGWLKNVTSGDDTAGFGTDYGTAYGITPPPGQEDTVGLVFTANNTDGVRGGATVYSTDSFSGQYALNFDMWHNFPGNAPGGGSGSSEIGGGGVGYDGVSTNGLLADGAGTYTTVWGDAMSGRDYRLYKNSGEQFVASGQYNVATNNHSSPEFATIAPPVDISTFDPPQTGQAGTTWAGQPGFHWLHMLMVVDESAGTASVQYGTLLLGTVDMNVGSVSPLSGPISLFHYDRYGSISSNPEGLAWCFAAYDNVVVSEAHTPGANGDFEGDVDVDNADYWYFRDCFEGPGITPIPSTGPGCKNACLDVFDADDDGDIDLADYAAFQRNRS
ncbi:MAG: hypothetical protein GY842_02005 [bacterium]|nr:hypothetical protein [bacterium]